jgi:hypothetical protein
VDQKLGLRQQTQVALALLPGLVPLGAALARLALTAEVALKPKYRVGAGPPSVVVNWTDRAAASVLALAPCGPWLSVLLRDLMGQTNVHHVADVLALLGSLKALLESYERLHAAPLPADVDADLVLLFVARLLASPHYVVAMYALRWLYDCVDFLPEALRAAVFDHVLDAAVLPRLFCHWEPGVAHLAHMLLVHRLFDPDCVAQQVPLLAALAAQLAAPPPLVPMDARHFADGVGNPAVNGARRRQVLALQAFLCELAHPDPPRWVCPVHAAAAAAGAGAGTCGCPLPPLRRPAAVAALGRFRAVVATAGPWVRDHRIDAASDELYPPITLALPPTHNMTSAYARGRGGPGGPGGPGAADF